VRQIDPTSEDHQVAGVRALRARRDATLCRSALAVVEASARDGSNLVPPIVAAVEAGATLGEIADALRRVFSEHRDTLI